MKTIVKNLAVEYALGAIEAEQIKEESNCSDEEYNEALEYAKKYSRAYDGFISWMEELDKNYSLEISVLQTARMHITFDKVNNVFQVVELVYFPGNTYRDPDVDIVEYHVNPVEAFKLVKPELHEFLNEK